MPVLVAIQDDEMRSALSTLLEDEGCEVMTADRGLTAFTLLARSAQPCVVLLDIFLGDHAAAEQLLSLAGAGGPWMCHAYVVLSTVDPRLWSPRLTELIETERMPVLHLPRDLDSLVPVVSQAEAAPHADCGCGVEALSA